MDRIEDCPSLPSDIWFEILLRLPFKELVKLKCVCRYWRDLITSRLFTRRHPDNSPSFMFMKYTPSPPRIGSINCVSFNFDSGKEFVQVKVSRLPDPAVDGVRPYFKIHDSCGGLLLITVYDLDPSELCLYNPVSGSCEVLPGQEHLPLGCWDWNLVNVEGASTDRYTVIGLNPSSFANIRRPKCCVLLDHSSDSWKELAVPRGTNMCTIVARGARRNGKVYWLVRDWEKSYFTGRHILETNLLSFDPADLQFRYKPCSPITVKFHRFFEFEYDGAFYLSYHPQDEPYGMELWVSRDLDSRRPVWSKLHVTTSNGLCRRLSAGYEDFYPVAVLRGSNKILSISTKSREIAVYDMVSEGWEGIQLEVDEEADENKLEWEYHFVHYKVA